jgi:hypothetical protein
VAVKSTGDIEVKPRETTAVIDDEDQGLSQEPRQNAIDLLRSWREVDEAGIQDQIETWEALKKALGEDRDSYRKLFP